MPIRAARSSRLRCGSAASISVASWRVVDVGRRRCLVPVGCSICGRRLSCGSAGPWDRARAAAVFGCGKWCLADLVNVSSFASGKARDEAGRMKTSISTMRRRATAGQAAMPATMVAARMRTSEWCCGSVWFADRCVRVMGRGDGSGVARGDRHRPQSNVSGLTAATVAE